jgi:hypothetical protein
MSRRGTDAEQEFGSDSFLDIIANIVGILIILIVVAGVKVARQGDDVVTDHSTPTPQTQPLTDEPSGLICAPTEWPWEDSAQIAKAARTVSSDGSAAFGFTNILPGSIAGAAQVDTDADTQSLRSMSAADSYADQNVSPADLDQQIAELTLNLRSTHQTTASTVEELTQLLASEQQQQQAEFHRLQGQGFAHAALKGAARRHLRQGEQETHHVVDTGSALRHHGQRALARGRSRGSIC